MVRECRPLERELSRLKLGRRSTMRTSVPANVSSAASIIPVGPPPAITTACSDITPLLVSQHLSGNSAPYPGACGKPGGRYYIEVEGVGLTSPCCPRAHRYRRWLVASSL